MLKVEWLRKFYISANNNHHGIGCYEFETIHPIHGMVDEYENDTFRLEIHSDGTRKVLVCSAEDFFVMEDVTDSFDVGRLAGSLMDCERAGGVPNCQPEYAEWLAEQGE